MGEFDLISRLTRGFGAGDESVRLGPGDDAAVVMPPAGMELVLAMDTLVEGVHFAGGTPPDMVGWKALAVNLSDLAAMGAEPRWATLSITHPDGAREWFSSFARGFHALARDQKVSLVGGDISRGPLSVTVQAHGVIERGRAIRRSGGRPGDLIYVTGTLGDAAAALDQAIVGRLREEHQDFLMDRLERPVPRTAIGMRLRQLATSAIDLSDGLASDLKRVIMASGTGAAIQLDRLPTSEALARAVRPEQRHQLQVAGGDDYELCFTTPPDQDKQVELLLSWAGCGGARIGRLTDTGELRWFDGDKAVKLPQSGYDHFA